MYRPTFELACFTVISAEEKVAVLKAMLEALILANTFFLQRRPDTPDLYAAGIPYVAEPPGRDNWQDIPRTIAIREGDCEDLASWLIAQLRVKKGERAMPDVTSKKIGDFTLYHIRVRRGDGVRQPDGTIGTVEDPSKILGMK